MPDLMNISIMGILSLFGGGIITNVYTRISKVEDKKLDKDVCKQHILDQTQLYQEADKHINQRFDKLEDKFLRLCSTIEHQVRITAKLEGQVTVLIETLNGGKDDRH